jgi:hypothetical protein
MLRDCLQTVLIVSGKHLNTCRKGAANKGEFVDGKALATHKRKSVALLVDDLRLIDYDL